MPSNTRDAHTTLNNVYGQMTGAENIASVTYADIVTAAQTWDDSQKDHFVDSLSNAYMRDVFTDTEFRDRTNDIFYEDAESFGAITRIIDVEIPDTIKSSAWETFVSGTSTIGSHTVYLPAVNEQLYINSTSWAVPLLISGNQYKSAFSSASGMREFDNFLRLSAENSVRIHRAEMNGANRNNYIITKWNLQQSQTTKTHVVNLVAEYCLDTGKQSMTANEFLNDANALRHTVRILKKYKSLLMHPTVMFTGNASSNGKFCPDDRFVMQILSDFEGRILSEVYSNTYHDEFVKLPLYRTSPAWQGLKMAKGTLDFTTLSSIKGIAVGAEESTLLTGIVGFMCDKWAIMHTNIENRVGIDRDDIRNVTYYEYQFTDKFLNNMNLNGVVFIVGDYGE